MFLEKILKEIELLEYVVKDLNEDIAKLQTLIGELNSTDKTPEVRVACIYLSLKNMKVTASVANELDITLSDGKKVTPKAVSLILKDETNSLPKAIKKRANSIAGDNQAQISRSVMAQSSRW